MNRDDSEVAYRFARAYPAIVKMTSRWYQTVQFKHFQLLYEFFGRNVPEDYVKPKKKLRRVTSNHFYKYREASGVRFE